MLYRLAADGVVVVHGLFIVFAVLGGLLALRWYWIIWLHLPAAMWGVVVEFTGWYCPLTPLENHFRRAAGEAGYGTSFVEHYLLPLIYPGGLTREIQLILGGFVLLINLGIYGVIAYHWRSRRGDAD